MPNDSGMKEESHIDVFNAESIAEDLEDRQQTATALMESAVNLVLVKDDQKVNGEQSVVDEDSKEMGYGSGNSTIGPNNSQDGDDSSTMKRIRQSVISECIGGEETGDLVDRSAQPGEDEEGAVPTPTVSSSSQDQPQDTRPFGAAQTTTRTPRTSVTAPGAVRVFPTRPSQRISSSAEVQLNGSLSEGVTLDDRSNYNHTSINHPGTEHRQETSTPFDAEVVQDDDLEVAVRARMAQRTIVLNSTQVVQEDISGGGNQRRPSHRRSGRKDQEDEKAGGFQIPSCFVVVCVLAGVTVLTVLLALIVTPNIRQRGAVRGNDNRSQATDESTTSFNDMLTAIVETVSIENVLTDETSPQYEALQWLLNEDLYVTAVAENTTDDILLGIDDTKFLLTVQQRYILALFYFATNGPTKWVDDLGFLNATANVCEWNVPPESEVSLGYGVRCNDQDVVTDIGIRKWKI